MSEWNVTECELGRDLRQRRCHIEASCSRAGCNVEAHYCDCAFFTVRDGSPVEARASEVAKELRDLATVWRELEDVQPERDSLRLEALASQLEAPDVSGQEPR